ncbi:3-oxoacyl-[acyl-carrier-protein (ACP)] synthase III [Helicosporidium sp. ATCC 50920]|nr:3-oxoacyl-[acyl-carrier-protein (ACP)] synthase III [Helicosporidium sp. ATCC 50920]|eukprot:KDD74570.1 3-oxoacyl-[acyl-carrier-protein (ACP)] synthase III [Helicosporidium sp. ATCC 50920]
MMDTSDEWIVTRTGIRRRHILRAEERLSDHAVRASHRALDMAGVSGSDLDLILFATSTPDDAFGSACAVQRGVEAKRALAYDITAACSGFVVALTAAAHHVRAGAARKVLVVGGDAMSRLVDWRDRATCILFGDGCGAVVVERAECGEGAEGGVRRDKDVMLGSQRKVSDSAKPTPSCALLGSELGSDGSGQSMLHASAVSSVGAELPLSGACSGSAAASLAYSHVHMQGSEVYKFAVRAVPGALLRALDQAELRPADVDWFALHQANSRILGAVAERLKVSTDKVLNNIAEYGNTSAGSIPLVLDEAVRRGDVKEGDVLALAGFGGGLTWAAAVIKWGRW